MEVILQADFPSLGYVGDRVRVRDGYARNFLVPRGIAVEASSRNAKQLQHKLSIIQAKKAKLKATSQEFAKRFEGLILEFTLKMGEQGKSFGSITTKDVDTELRKHGIEIERKQIRLNESVRNAGEYKVDIKLHAEVVVPLTLRVTQEKLAHRDSEGAESEGRKGGRRRGKGRGGRGASSEPSADSGDNTAVQAASNESESE